MSVIFAVFCFIILRSSETCDCGGNDWTEIVASIREIVIPGTNLLFRTRTFSESNTQVFGPTLHFKPGQRARIKLVNNMQEDIGPIPPTVDQYLSVMNKRYWGLRGCDFPFDNLPIPTNASEFHIDSKNIPHGFNSINLHFHGLQIVPHLFHPVGTTNPEASLIKVDPGECYCYEFDIPRDHPTGTYWYHPHWHGSVAIQTWSGMAGLIYIHGKFDEELELYGINTHSPFVIWDPHYRHNNGNQISVNNFLDGQTDYTDEVSEIRFLVNGAFQPSFQYRPGETIHHRILCATVENLAMYQIINQAGDPIPFYAIARDGIAYNSTMQLTSIILAGGQRLDILFQLPTTGLYRVVQMGLEHLQFFCTGPDNLTLAYFEAQGEFVESPLVLSNLTFTSGIRSDQTITPDEIQNARHITFALQGDSKSLPFPQFLVNNQSYDEFHIEYHIQDGSVEEWTIENHDLTIHPFHIHVNAFQVKSIESNYMQDDPYMHSMIQNNLQTSLWVDTVIVPPRGKVVVWTRFQKGYAGKTVFHCHFLAHEDTGMIMNFMLECSD